MEGFLAARHAAVRAFSLMLLHEQAPATEVKVGLATAGRAAEHFARLLRERLGALALSAPVEAIRLEAGDLEPLPGKNGGLFGDPRRPVRRRAMAAPGRAAAGAAGPRCGAWAGHA